MKRDRSVIIEIIWASSGQVLAVILMIVMIKIWAVYLEPDDFGLMSLIISIPSILLGVSLNPIFQSLLVHYNDNTQHEYLRTVRLVSLDIVRNRASRVLLTIIGFGLPLTLILGIHWTTPFLVSGLFIADALRVFEQRLLIASRRQREAAFLSAGDIFFRLVIVWVSLDIFQPTAYVAIIGNLIGALLFVSLMYLTQKSDHFSSDQGGISIDLKDEIASKMLDFSKPLLPSAILANATEMGNRYLIGAILGLQETGLFVAAYGLVKRPYGMLNQVGEMVMSPILRHAITSGTVEETAQARRRYLLFIAVFSFTGVVLFTLFRDILIIIFLSEKYAPISYMLPGLALSIALFNISNVFNWFSMTIGGSRAVLTNNLVGGFTTISLTIILCIYKGLAGAIGALFVGYSLQLIASVITFNAIRKTHQVEASPL